MALQVTAGLNRENVTGGLEKIHKEELHNLHSPQNFFYYDE